MESWELAQKQSLPLKAKIILSKQRIKEWYEHWNGDVYVAFSGGRDSTVLLHLVRDVYPDVPAVFCDTGLEYPEIKQFVKTIPNVTTIKPEMNFKKVIDEYGYPVASKKIARMIRDLQNPTSNNKQVRKLYLTGIKKDGSYSDDFLLPKKWRKLINAPFKVSEKCCDIMKKSPFKKYEKDTGNKCIIGVMACDSEQRKTSYLKTGCYTFENGKVQCKPIGFWLHNDILSCIEQNNISYCPIYDMGIENTGCMFCMFGVHLENKPNRFQQMRYTHPKIWKYCIDDMGVGKVMDYIGVDYGRCNLDDFI